MKMWPLLAFIGLYWPLLAFIGLYQTIKPLQNNEKIENFLKKIYFLPEMQIPKTR